MFNEEGSSPAIALETDNSATRLQPAAPRCHGYLRRLPITDSSKARGERRQPKGTGRAPTFAAAGPSFPGFEDDVAQSYWSLERNGNAQEGRRNGGGILARALVVAVEQNFQLLLQITGSTVLLCGLECIHGRPVECFECINEL